MKNKTTNILSFPIHKVRKDLDYSSPIAPEQRRNIIAASLVGVFTFITIVNTYLAPTRMAATEIQQREIASVREPSSSILEKSLIERYSKNKVSGLTIAAKPNHFQKLAIGKLEGKYNLTMLSGKILAIEIIDGKNQPQKLDSPSSFLRTNRELLEVQFDKVAKVSERREANSRSEEYALLNRSDIQVGTAAFNFDKNGHFLSMKLEKTQKVASH